MLRKEKPKEWIFDEYKVNINEKKVIETFHELIFRI